MDTAVERSETKVVEETGRTSTAEGALPGIAEPRAVAPRDARELSRQFFHRLSQLEEGTHEYQYARNTLIEMNISLVRFAAGRFRGRGDDMEDIVQTGTIGLIKAIDRFDLSREVEFTSFALPYIVGEIKRFFRDTTWAVHVPRRLQELRVELAKARDELSSRLDREPTVAELATLMNISENEVIEGQIASNGYNSSSLDAALTGDGPENGESVLADFIGVEEDGLRLVEDFHSLAPLMAELGERDRQIIHMRFVEEATQAEIGERLGCSQMHVSRLIKRIITRLREGMLGELGCA
ncbi:RNA polymerase sigma factor SigF [Streptomyces spinosirectus]|jgi:RNA polymerase sigma-B factor|uniref:RNA polymerase sigma factor SigF n=1 Tax=Streptomyces TaxID=1883 RepID=UPI000D38C8F4|nr:MULTISPECIES: RNA polymerase sigma factor SigF [Streptomyces]MBY8339503.1 RNA polymerase sigma factor SigF [Streptomyces plumbidurans]PTM93233.1 RNA polymerase sigma-B factor [Streptomyces sp. VMFN-G11Ma]UIR15969.1 RNA polymerase sigma factor SigF [Streptomyces spinosirectus]